MKSIIIDNSIIYNLKNGICIRPISLAKKINPNLNIDSIKKITYGNRKKDNSVISQLATGVLKYENLISGSVSHI